MRARHRARASLFERAAWLLGFALLACYVGAHLFSARASQEGIATFRQVRLTPAPVSDHERFTAVADVAAETAPRPAFGSATAPLTDITNPSPPPGLALALPAAPDTSTWSIARVAAFVSAPKGRDVPEAILHIDSIGLEVPVYRGTGEWNLNRGAGRIEGTPPVAAGGNTGIAAHRDGYFRALKDVQVGDTLMVETLEDAIKYRVASTSVVNPDDVHVLAPTPHASLTLVTCYPFHHLGPAPQRYVVHARREDAFELQ